MCETQRLSQAGLYNVSYTNLGAKLWINRHGLNDLGGILLEFSLHDIQAFS